jgi:hypothetical protein
MYINNSPERITIKGYKRDDCTVNAIGNAIGVSYDLARKILQVGIYYQGKFKFAKSKPRTKLQFTLKTHVKRICKALSTDEIIYAKYNPRTNRPIMTKTLAEVASENSKGIYIAIVKGHLATIINGKIIDTWDSSKSKVEVIYKVDVNQARNTIKDLAKFYRMDSDRHIIKNHTKRYQKVAD